MESEIPWNGMEFDGTVPSGLDKNFAKFQGRDSTSMIPKFHSIPFPFPNTFTNMIALSFFPFHILSMTLHSTK